MEELVGDVHAEDVDLGGSGFVWGAWYEMVDEEEVLSYSLVSFLADVSPLLLPDSLASKREAPYWVPTLAMSIDFKHHIPTPSELASLPGVAPRTIGVLYTSKYLIDGRHDVVAEIWTAPSPIGQGYILGLIIQACNLVQASTSQSEPLYLSAQFLGASSVGPCAIQVNRIKTGRSYCNLTATLGQK
ncbi:hypothetical protein FRC15_002630, partial [Serendipita sp. 397]